MENRELATRKPFHKAAQGDGGKATTAHVLYVVEGFGAPTIPQSVERSQRP